MITNYENINAVNNDNTRGENDTHTENHQTSSNHENYLTSRISSAFQKWNELKHVLTDQRIKMSTRITFLEVCVRSRLLYSVQTWDMKQHEKLKLESVWNGFLRKMVANGYKRKNAPKHNKGWKLLPN